MKKGKKNLRRNRRRKVKSNNLIILLIIGLIIIFITPKMFSAAKYVYNAVYEYYLSSKDFHFSSDKLSINHTQYQVTNNWSGAETYRVIINMSSKENDKSFTEADIDYEITVTSSDNISCTLSKAQGTIKGTGSGGVNEDAFYVNIDPLGGTALPNGAVAWIEVVATSTSPYRQSVSGKLIFEVGTASVSYEIIDAANQPYLTVNVINSTAGSANVSLSYSPQNVLLDMTSRFYLNSTGNLTEQINEHTYLNSITAAVNGLSTTSVKFYKTDSTQDYSYTAATGGTPIITLSTN